MKLYRVSDTPTLGDIPAGPDESNYLAFVPGDIVVVKNVTKGVAEAIRLSDGIPQSVDKSSLELIGKACRAGTLVKKRLFDAGIEFEDVVRA